MSKTITLTAEEIRDIGKAASAIRFYVAYGSDKLTDEATRELLRITDMLATIENLYLSAK